MAYEDFKDLNRTTATEHVLRDKAFNLAKNPKYDINADLLYNFWFIIFLIKKLLVKDIVKNESISNKELTEELRKPVIRKFQKRKVSSNINEVIKSLSNFLFFLQKHLTHTKSSKKH